MQVWACVVAVWKIQIFIMRRKKMKKDNFHIGFIVGMLTALFMAVVISCSVTPLEAGSTELGSNPYNPIYVKIVD